MEKSVCLDPMTRTGFYPGSFDPVTFGHLDVIARAARFLDKLVLGVGVHHGKTGFLPTDQRLDLLKAAVEPITAATGCEITMMTFDGLAVDAAREAGAGVIVRGLRDASDFDYEVQMGQMNAGLAPDIETVFLAASPATRMIASSLVKQIAKMGGDITPFVPEAVGEAIREALKQ
jgi:pantetheine-phosphate adenylyltransferase